MRIVRKPFRVFALTSCIALLVAEKAVKISSIGTAHETGHPGFDEQIMTSQRFPLQLLANLTIFLRSLPPWRPDALVLSLVVARLACGPGELSSAMQPYRRYAQRTSTLYSPHICPIQCCLA